MLLKRSLSKNTWGHFYNDHVLTQLHRGQWSILSAKFDVSVGRPIFFFFLLLATAHDYDSALCGIHQVTFCLAVKSMSIHFLKAWHTSGIKYKG